MGWGIPGDMDTSCFDFSYFEYDNEFIEASWATLAELKAAYEREGQDFGEGETRCLIRIMEKYAETRGADGVRLICIYTL